MIGSIFIITLAPLLYGYTYMAYKGTKGERVEIGDVFAGFSKDNFIKSWTLTLITGISIVIIVSIVTRIFGGTIGSIVQMIASLPLVYAMILLVIRNYGAIDAIKESLELAQKNPVETIILLVVTYVLVFVGTILLLIGLLITAPIAEIFSTYLTQEIMDSKPAGYIEQGI